MTNLIMLLLMMVALGAVAYVLVSFVAGLLPNQIGRRVTGFNLDLVMTMLGRALLIKRAHGGFRLKKSTFDTKVGEEKVYLGGEPRWFSDPSGFMSTFRGKPFGIAHEKRNTITTPVEADLGQRENELRSEGEWCITKDGTDYFRSFFHIDEGLQLVNMDGVLNVIQGGADSASVDRTFTFIELSQQRFDSANVADYMAWLAAMGVPFGLMLLASKVSTSSGGLPSNPVGLTMSIAGVIA